MDLVNEGAEAKIYLVNENTLEKVRISKKYRIEELDKKLRKLRTKREFKVLKLLFDSDVNVPEPNEIDEKNFSFKCERLIGDVLMDCLNENLLEKGFREIIKMHSLDVVHGDLTTLNMICCEDEVFIIDFGLSELNGRVEDKAVDLNLFFNCIKNEHPEFYSMKEGLEEKYLETSFGKKVIERLKNVEKRGRNKS